MSHLCRIISIDVCVDDVRRLRACLHDQADRQVSVHHLADPHDAIARLPKMRADVLFIDEDLPRVTGVETIRALRAGGEVRPIVATTRTDCGYLAADLVLAGADGYLAKDDLHPLLVGRVLDRAIQTARGRTANDQLRRSAVRQIIAKRVRAGMGLV